jgi:hypothetical protein
VLEPAAHHFLDLFHDDELNRDREIHSHIAYVPEKGKCLNIVVRIRPKGTGSEDSVGGGINLERDEVQKLRDLCDAFLNQAPSLEDKEYEEIRAKLLVEHST